MPFLRGDTIPTTILIADDHFGLAQSLALSLREWYVVLAPVTTLTFLPVALTLAQPEILLLDLSFGLESALQRLPGLVRDFPHIKIIIFTNHDEEVFVEATRMAGAHGFLSKTVSIEEICAEIQRVRPVAAEPTSRALVGADSRSWAELTDLSRADMHQAVLWLLASRFTHTQAAERIGVSVKTIEYHVAKERSAS